MASGKQRGPAENDGTILGEDNDTVDLSLPDSVCSICNYTIPGLRFTPFGWHYCCRPCLCGRNPERPAGIRIPLNLKPSDAVTRDCATSVWFCQCFRDFCAKNPTYVVGYCFKRGIELAMEYGGVSQLEASFFFRQNWMNINPDDIDRLIKQAIMKESKNQGKDPQKVLLPERITIITKAFLGARDLSSDQKRDYVGEELSGDRRKRMKPNDDDSDLQTKEKWSNVRMVCE